MHVGSFAETLCGFHGRDPPSHRRFSRLSSTVATASLQRIAVPLGSISFQRQHSPPATPPAAATLLAASPAPVRSLHEKVIERIDHHFKRILGSEATLEIDYKVMVQILAATWLSDNKRAIADWIEQVLCRGFAEAQQKYDSTACCVKLRAIGALALEEQAHRICLPASISLN